MASIKETLGKLVPTPEPEIPEYDFLKHGIIPGKETRYVKKHEDGPTVIEFVPFHAPVVNAADVVKPIVELPQTDSIKEDPS